MKQEHDDDDANDDRLFQQIALQRLDRILNQPGAVVPRNQFHSRWQRSLDLGKLLLHPVDHVKSVQPVAHDDDAANGFAPNVWAKRNSPQIFD